jgi:hypothetical protein
MGALLLATTANLSQDPILVCFNRHVGSGCTLCADISALMADLEEFSLNGSRLLQEKLIPPNTFSPPPPVAVSKRNYVEDEVLTFLKEMQFAPVDADKLLDIYVNLFFESDRKKCLLRLWPDRPKPKARAEERISWLRLQLKLDNLGIFYEDH